MNLSLSFLAKPHPAPKLHSILTDTIWGWVCGKKKILGTYRKDRRGPAMFNAAKKIK